MSRWNSIRWLVNPASLCAGFFILAACTRGSVSLSNKTVLQVNSETMTAREFAEELARHLKEFDALTVKDKAILERAKQNVIQNFIVRTVTQDFARSKNILVRREDLEKNLNKVRASYPDDLAFRRALADEGLRYDDWKEKVRFSMLQKMVMEEINKSVRPPESKEIQDYYENHRDDFKQGEQIRLRQIVLDTENNAKRIYDELRAGKKMEDLARKFSIAPEAQNGGDIGWIEKGTLDIFDKAFSLKVGQRSGIVKGAFGYHIMEVTGRRTARTLPLEEVKDRIVRILAGKREQAGFAAWMENQIRLAKVFKDEKLIASITVETRSQ